MFEIYTAVVPRKDNPIGELVEKIYEGVYVVYCIIESVYFNGVPYWKVTSVYRDEKTSEDG